MDVTLNASNTYGFAVIALPGESGGMAGSHTFVGIPQCNMIVKYDLKGYSDKAALTEEQNTLMYVYIEAVDGGIVLKFNKFLLEEVENEIIVDGPQKIIYVFSDTVGERHGSNRVKAVINLSSGGRYKVSDTNQGKWLSHGILEGLARGFLALLAVVTDLLQDLPLLLPLGSRSTSTATTLKFSLP